MALSGHYYCPPRFASSPPFFISSCPPVLRGLSSSLGTRKSLAWPPPGCRSSSPGDDLGPYPWDPSWQDLNSEITKSSMEWTQEDIVTFFTTDGLIRIGGSRIPKQRKQTYKRQLAHLRKFREEDYMDPKQGLCLGAVFDIAATNGLDLNRRFCVFGFCRSIEMLSDVVEDTVLEQGGEVVMAEKGSEEGLNEKLSMSVAIPLLWGVPPAVDVLNYAIRSGGGIVEKVYWQWDFL